MEYKIRWILTIIITIGIIINVYLGIQAYKKEQRLKEYLGEWKNEENNTLIIYPNLEIWKGWETLEKVERIQNGEKENE